MAKLIDITGKALSGEWGTDDEKGIGIPVLRTTNFTNEGVVDYTDVVTRIITKKNITEKYLKPGDIIIEKSGGSDKQPVGRVIYFNGPEKKYLFNNFTGLLRVKEPNKWFPKYVFYSLFGNYRRGGTLPFENKTTGLHNLKTDDYVSRYEVKEAKYSKQIEISEYLDKLYFIFKMRENELVELDTLIKARFVELFGNVRNEDKYRGIPLRNLCTTMSGGTPSTKYPEYYEGDIPWISTVSLGPNHIDGSTAKGFITQEAIDNSATKLIPAGNILFGTRVGVGKSSLNDVDICTNQDIVAIVGIDETKYNRLFIKHVLDSYQSYYDSIKKGATILGITGDDLKDTLIPDVPIGIQLEFEQFVEQVDKSKVVIQKALTETQTLFDSLMQEYFG